MSATARLIILPILASACAATPAAGAPERPPAQYNPKELGNANGAPAYREGGVNDTTHRSAPQATIQANGQPQSSANIGDTATHEVGHRGVMGSTDIAASDLRTAPQSGDQSRTVQPTAKGLTNTVSYEIVSRPADTTGNQPAAGTTARTVQPTAKGLTNTVSYDVVSRPADTAGNQPAAGTTARKAPRKRPGSRAKRQHTPGF